MSEFRVMATTDGYQIQQRDRTAWYTVGEFEDLDKAKEMLRDLRGEGTKNGSSVLKNA